MTAALIKPPYRVPTMAETAALPWNGLNVVSTFAGAGGSSLGYRMAGFRVLWANEFVEAAREVYRLNAREGTIIDGRDIRAVKPEEILAATGLKQGELDVLDGSPPCAAFSTAGKRAKTWGKVRKYSDKTQKTDDLFFEFTRLVDGIRPRAFVAENVSGLVKGVAKGYFLEILAALKGCGYRVEARLLDAQWLGVPQARQRMIFIGLREDLGLKPAFPAPLPYRYSVRDALPWLNGTLVLGDPEHKIKPGSHFERGKRVPFEAPSPTIKASPGGISGSGHAIEARVIHDTSGLWGAGDVTDRPCPTITVGVNSVSSHHFRVEERAIEPEADITRFAIGAEWDKIGQGEQSERYFNLVRPSEHGPSPTVTADGGCSSLASVTHPTEKRKFTIAELKQICAFPTDFVLTGTYAQQWERLGRAVPPLMMFRVASTLRDVLLAGRA